MIESMEIMGKKTSIEFAAFVVDICNGLLKKACDWCEHYAIDRIVVLNDASANYEWMFNDLFDMIWHVNVNHILWYQSITEN